MSWASQNDSQIPSFVKNINVVGKKMARNSHKMPKPYHCPIRFRSEFSSLYPVDYLDFFFNDI